ncbi:hypothetical protein E2C01_069936 [Portunus trituberculatus]|uniref:Uncharacterized protein n=1 Tax=Portunus trituberculatus TaxID=210409 RepID=A0A5B7I0Q8_PORTR|nr:hypothetical protein [Portunus trituberculatus]
MTSPPPLSSFPSSPAPPQRQVCVDDDSDIREGDVRRERVEGEKPRTISGTTTKNCLKSCKCT